MTDQAAHILRAQRGDSDAFADLIGMYQAMVFGYALSMLGDAGLAEEVVQETFFAAHSSLPKLQNALAFPGWLRGVTRHQCYRVLRQRRSPTAPLDRACAVADPGPDPDELVHTEELRGQVWNAVMALPRAQRDVVILYYLQEQSQLQVAAFLGVPVSTVNMRLHAARKTLCRSLLATVKNDITDAPPPEFADVLGSILQVEGNLLKVRFRNGTQPALLNSIAVPDDALLTPAAFISQHLTDGSVRCITVAPSSTMHAGTEVIDARRPTETVLQSPILDHILRKAQRRPGATSLVVESGIKVIDLLCPMVRGGCVGIFGPVGAGKLVIVSELIYRLSKVNPGVSLLYFVQPGTELSHLHALPDPLPSAPAPMQSIYLPIEDPADLSSPTSVTARAALDAVVYMSRDLVIRRLYPAVDALLSSSSALESSIVGQEHYDIAQEVRRAIRDFRAAETVTSQDAAMSRADQTAVERGRRLQSFLTQDLFVAESYTRRSGQFFPLGETLTACRHLLAG